MISQPLIFSRITVLLGTLSFLVFTLLGILLTLSLSQISASAVTGISAILGVSIIILRLLEFIISSVISVSLFATMSMPNSSIVGFVLGIFLEALSFGFRSISLGFRLFANVSAGHVLADIAAIARFGSTFSSIGIVISVTHQFLILLYEFLVSCVQIGVFLALISVYAA
jgi:F0F1-type ATP synthase membrane subunit a